MASTVPTVLNRENYEDWSSRIKTYLLAKDLWDVLDQERPKTEDEDSKVWKKKDTKALSAIQNSCGDDTYKLIKDKITAKQAWDTLSNALKREEPSDENPPDEGGMYTSDENPPDEGDMRSILEAYPPSTYDDTLPHVLMEEGGPEQSEMWEVPGSMLRAGEGHETNDTDIRHRITFVKYVRSNDWDKAIKFLSQHRQVGSARIEMNIGTILEQNVISVSIDVTALHYAIYNFKSCGVRIIQQLVELMAKEDLEIQDYMGCTALYYIINYCPENVEVAECMVEKNDKLLTILPRVVKVPLVVDAQSREKGERMARYLYSLTSHETLTVSNAAQLISLGFRLQRFDIAWDLIQRCPKLVMAKDHDGNIPLVTLASNRFAFKSGSPLTLWEKLIYDGIRIKRLPPINKDSHLNVEKHESDQSDQRHLSNQKRNQRHLLSSGMDLCRGLVTNLQTLLGTINRIYQIKLVHERVNQFLPLMCKVVSVESMTYHERAYLNAALCLAAERGHVEYITHFLRYSSYPLNDVKNGKGQNLLQIAVECRHHEVYNVIMYIYDQLRKREHTLGLPKFNEKWNFSSNMLHTVASITPLSQIDHIQGATLQMQRELQWFKEVESIADPKYYESVNEDGKTPRKVFMENHKELRKEAEKSMKETSTSCTVVGALIVTIMFAAAFTVPGGNDDKTGFPIFITKKVFIAFIVSDAISLFSSTTSVIMFLGILTSRFSEDDFYKSLPTKMIIGLFTLFLSIATMMIVFSCGIYIMLDGKSSIVIPSILLASVPVTSFIWMQFPLLVELFISTFGRGIFDRNQKKLF